MLACFSCFHHIAAMILISFRLLIIKATIVSFFHIFFYSFNIKEFISPLHTFYSFLLTVGSRLVCVGIAVLTFPLTPLQDTHRVTWCRMRLRGSSVSRKSVAYFCLEKTNSSFNFFYELNEYLQSLKRYPCLQNPEEFEFTVPGICLLTLSEVFQFTFLVKTLCNMFIVFSWWKKGWWELKTMDPCAKITNTVPSDNNNVSFISCRRLICYLSSPLLYL